MKLTLVRHGEMTGDPFICPERPVQGCLTEKTGVLQAEATAYALKDVRFDIAFSSPMGRALQTAEIVLAGRDIEIKIIPSIHEWMPSEEVQKISSEEFEAIMKKQSEAYIEETWKTEAGEGTLEMQARIIPPFLKELGKLGIHSRMGGYVLDEHARDLSIVVFAHGGSLGVLMNFLLGVRSFPISSFSFEHTGVAVIEFTERRGIYYPQLVISALHCIGRKQS
jgi:broad specificity phosphatase PhoE